MARAILVATLLCCTWFAWGFTPWGQLRYIAKQTSIALPLFPANLHVYDDSEMVVVTHLTLETELARSLSRDPRFRSFERNPYPRPFPYATPSQFRHIRDLPAEFGRLQHNPDVYQAGGCASKTSWFGLLDARTGSLWIEVHYPDWAGDEPGCLMDAVAAAEELQRISSPLDR